MQRRKVGASGTLRRVCTVQDAAAVLDVAEAESGGAEPRLSNGVAKGGVQASVRLLHTKVPEYYMLPARRTLSNRQNHMGHGPFLSAAVEAAWRPSTYSTTCAFTAALWISCGDATGTTAYIAP